MPEKRLIDANSLRRNLSSRYMNELYPDWRILPELTKMRIEILAKEFRYALDHAPTIDAVEVVRCRDCAQADILDAMRIVHCNRWQTCTLADGYCHCGTKRDGGADNV